MVSIILPTFNRGHIIKESIDSILRQTYTNFELLVIDDGSDDDTAAVVRQIPDERIHYFALPHSGYISRIRNYGIRQSKGLLIAMMDSDDRWMDNKLEQQIDLLTANPAAGFSITGATDFRGDQVVSENIYPDRTGADCTSVFREMVENRFIFYTPTLLFHRACLEKAGWHDESMQWCADFQFSIRLAYYYPAAIIYDPMMWRRLHNSNRSTVHSLENYSGYIQTFDYLLQENMISMRDYRKAKGLAFFKMAELLQQRQQPAAARNNYLKSLLQRPFQPRCYKGLLQTVIR